MGKAKLIIIASTPAAMASASASYVGTPGTTKAFGQFPSVLTDAASVAAMFGSGPMGDVKNIGRVTNVVLSATLTLVAFAYNSPDAASDVVSVTMAPATAMSSVIELDYFSDPSKTDPLIIMAVSGLIKDLVESNLIESKAF